MAARSVRVFLHNETDATLVLQRQEVEGGEWGPGERPPERIGPGEVGAYRTRSSGLFSVASGTEGRAWYVVEGDATRTVYTHWDKPFLGPSGYHINTDGQQYGFWYGGRGDHASVHFVVRPGRRVETNFVPQFDGFHFANRWNNLPYTPPFLRGLPASDLMKFANANNGLCGGMVYLALDYFHAGMAIPEDTEAPASADSPLFKNIVDRLFDTFTVDSVSLMLALINPVYPDTDENPLTWAGVASGRAAVMAHEEWPLIRGDIDAGRPSPITLLTVKSLWPGALGECHQVLAYAYEARGHDITLHVYDPNTPQDADSAPVYMKFNDADISRRIVVDHNVGIGGRPVYCFIRMEYAAKTPTVPTGPRFRPAAGGFVPPEARVHADWHTEIIDGAVLERGRRLFDVLPDCGQQEFDYTVTRQHLRYHARARPENFRDPEVTWYVDGRPLGQGTTTHTERVEPVDALVPGEESGGEGTEPSVATYVTVVDGDRLSIENDPEDASYRLSVRVACRERGSERDAHWMDDFVEIEGRLETVPGLGAAINSCFMSWLDRLRLEAPSEEEIIRAAYAQLGRPLDPLWDPDPLQLDPGDWEVLPDAGWDPLAEVIDAMQAPPPGVDGDELLIIPDDAVKWVVVDEGDVNVLVDSTDRRNQVLVVTETVKTVLDLWAEGTRLGAGQGDSG